MINGNSLVNQRLVMKKFLLLFSIIVPLPTVFSEKLIQTVTFQYNLFFLLKNCVNIRLRLRSLFLYCSEVASCVGCNALYIGQTVCHLSTRLRKRNYKAAPVRQQVDACYVPKSTIPSSTRNLDSSNSLSTVLSMEAPNIPSYDHP